MRLENVYRLGVKELWGLARNPTLALLIVYAFTVMIFTASRAVPETLSKAPIAIVDEDRSQVSTRIVGAFYPPLFSGPRLIDRAEMDRRMDRGLDTFALDIPPRFQQDLLAGRTPAIQLNIDATRIAQAFAGGGYVQEIVSGEVESFLQKYRGAERLPVDLDVRVLFNQNLSKGWFGAINNIVLSVTLLGLVLTGAALIREREHGTIEHLLVMPVTPTEIMVSKIWSMGLVVLVACGLSLAVVVKGWLHVPIAGSVTLFLFGTALQLFAITSLGIFLATVAGSMPQFGMLLVLVLLPLHILSGSVTPRESMPEFIQAMMLFTPNTHFVLFAQAVLFRGAGLGAVWPQLVALAAIGMVLFGFSLSRFRAFLR